MKKKIEIKKIPLEILIEILEEIYDSGVDFINIIVEKGDTQDHIWIMQGESPESTKEIKTEIDPEALI